MVTLWYSILETNNLPTPAFLYRIKWVYIAFFKRTTNGGGVFGILDEDEGYTPVWMTIRK